MKRVDVLIVGAGVAGAMAAVHLSRAGLGVLLVDRAAFPRHKVCGCCLNHEAVSSLADAGLSHALREAGARPIDRIVVRCGRRSIALPSRGGVSLSRFKLDALLIQAAQQAGCEVLTETTARITQLPTHENEYVAVDLSSANALVDASIQARVVLVADGLAGSCTAAIDQARRQTKPASLRGYGTQLPAAAHDQPAGRVVMHCGSGGYVGTVVLEDGSLDVAAAMKPAWVKACRAPGAAAEQLLSAAGQTLPSLDAYAWRATAPLTGARDQPWLAGVLFLGDAAGYIEPFTGEGMAWAMRSATTAVPFAIQAANGWHDAIGKAWQQAYHDAVGRQQWRCKLFSALLARPRLLSVGLAASSVLPPKLQTLAARATMPAMFRPAHRPHTPELATT